jgi:hypothetical protein
MEQKESKSNKHFIISIIKSVVRIIAGVTLTFGNVVIAGILLVTAEILGIAEEL